MTIREYDTDDQQQANDLLAETTSNFVAYLAIEYNLPVTRASYLCGLILQVLPEKMHETPDFRESIRQIVAIQFSQ
ncbi:MAG: hypothetical protein RM049_03640 [Nostoc sp. DedQUE04]|uniref:hypothetical protein n=1 Tax=Nostoc sp. DedQUE04 TaxID=3075390 RepID=UPI002AD27B45|nr:hypothetical protein [Nostoc sp. DedQUE04]MDZ8134378.1 hypothetical protein [Nostoc sp. DedQUE04]